VFPVNILPLNLKAPLMLARIACGPALFSAASGTWPVAELSEYFLP
jgi:hypothetical protein